MCENTINKILISTSSIMVSKKLLKDYQNGKEISVHGCSINKFLGTVDVNESEHIDSDMLVCFDEKLNSLGIMKVGISGYVIPIKDSSSSFINLYKPVLATSKPEESSYAARVRCEIPVELMERVSI